MEYYSFDSRSLLSPRTSIGFHKRLKITRGRYKSRDQPRDSGPNSRSKFAMVFKMVFKMQMST